MEDSRSRKLHFSQTVDDDDDEDEGEDDGEDEDEDENPRYVICLCVFTSF